MKKIFLLSFLLSAAFSLKAQVVYNYPKYTIGGGVGIGTAFAGTKTLTNEAIYNASFAYYYTPFVAFSINGQLGKLAGGDAVHDEFKKQFTSNISAFYAKADVQLGQFVDYSGDPFLNGIKNFYAGTGIGFLNNNITSIHQLDLQYIKTSTNAVLPLDLGFECNIFSHGDVPVLKIDLCYTINTVFGNGLDGYLDPSESSTKFYNYASISFKYGLGNNTTYKKPLHMTQ